MIHYTERIAVLMRDIVTRVQPLAFIDMSRVLVFARFGRSDADGPFATCHCLTLPASEPGYYFWRDRRTGKVTRRSEWFITKSPEVRLGTRRLEYLISFVLPRFCDQSLTRSRKRIHYPGAPEWMAKLDTLVHELYHIDPQHGGIRRLARADGTYSPRSHGPGFYEQVADMVRAYLASGPAPETYDFLRYDFTALQERFSGVVGTTFRNFPSFPQRYREPLPEQPVDPCVHVELLKRPTQPAVYTEADLHVHQFSCRAARRVPATGRFPSRSRSRLGRVPARVPGPEAAISPVAVAAIQ
jgi:hypothetical protein